MAIVPRAGAPVAAWRSSLRLLGKGSDLPMRRIPGTSVATQLRETSHCRDIRFGSQNHISPFDHPLASNLLHGLKVEDEALGWHQHRRGNTYEQPGGGSV